MLDLGYSFGLKDYEFNRFEMNMSHGYQFNPYVFLGGGFGVHFMEEYKEDLYVAHDHRENLVDVPLFTNARFTFIKSRITPVIDIKAGYYVTNHGGLYINTSVGCRFSIWSRHAINILLGYSYEDLQFDTFGNFISTYSMAHTRYNKNYATNSLSFKIGFEL